MKKAQPTKAKDRGSLTLNEILDADNHMNYLPGDRLPNLTIPARDRQVAVKAARVLADPSVSDEVKEPILDTINDLGMATTVSCLHPALIERALTLMFESKNYGHGKADAQKDRKKLRALIAAVPVSEQTHQPDNFKDGKPSRSITKPQERNSMRKKKSTKPKSADELYQLCSIASPEVRDMLASILIDLNVIPELASRHVAAEVFMCAITKIADLMDALDGGSWRKHLSYDMCFAVNYSESQTRHEPPKPTPKPKIKSEDRVVIDGAEHLGAFLVLGVKDGYAEIASVGNPIPLEELRHSYQPNAEEQPDQTIDVTTPGIERLKSQLARLEWLPENEATRFKLQTEISRLEREMASEAWPEIIGGSD
jgi:hypothetical protein